MERQCLATKARIFVPACIIIILFSLSLAFSYYMMFNIEYILDNREFALNKNAKILFTRVFFVLMHYFYFLMLRYLFCIIYDFRGIKECAISHDGTYLYFGDHLIFSLKQIKRSYVVNNISLFNPYRKLFIENKNGTIFSCHFAFKETEKNIVSSIMELQNAD